MCALLLNDKKHWTLCLSVQQGQKKKGGGLLALCFVAKDCGSNGSEVG